MRNEIMIDRYNVYINYMKKVKYFTRCVADACIDTANPQLNAYAVCLYLLYVLGSTANVQRKTCFTVLALKYILCSIIERRKLIFVF